jgi:hypothetical protein
MCPAPPVPSTSAAVKDRGGLQLVPRQHFLIAACSFLGMMGTLGRAGNQTPKKGNEGTGGRRDNYNQAGQILPPLTPRGKRVET